MPLKLTHRFFRGASRDVAGSGLLPIVETIMRRAGGSLGLANRTGGGLDAMRAVPQA